MEKVNGSWTLKPGMKIVHPELGTVETVVIEDGHAKLNDGNGTHCYNELPKPLTEYTIVSRDMQEEAKYIKCEYCGKYVLAGETITRDIYVNRGYKTQRFCSTQCASYAQMSAEG